MSFFFGFDLVGFNWLIFMVRNWKIVNGIKL